MRYSGSVLQVVHWVWLSCILLLVLWGQRDIWAQAGGPEQPVGKEHITVVVSGIGVDEEGALRNAWSNAVRQAVGSLISSETLVQNDQVIKDEVLVYSDGLVVKTERLSGGKRDDGLFEVSIRALVETKKLQERLEGAKITVSNVDTTSAVAEIVTTQEKRASAIEMVSKAMEGFPESLLEVKVGSSEPIVKELRDGKVEATWPILVSFRRDLYYDVFVPRLESVIDRICINKADLRSGESTLKPKKQHGFVLPYGLEPTYDLDFLPAFRNEFSQYRNSHRDNNRTTLLMATSKASAVYGDNWSLYTIDQSAYSALDREYRRTLYINISFMDDVGKVLNNVTLRFGNKFDGVIYPCIRSGGDYGYCYKMNAQLTCDSSLLLRVRAINCTIEKSS